MLERLVSFTVPKEAFEQELLASALSDYVLLQVLEKCNSNIAQAAEVLKSPSFFCITNSFMIKEYLKNTADKMQEMQTKGELPQDNSLHISFYAKIHKDNSSTCMVHDDGSGFPDKFLARNNNETMVDYYQKKMLGADGAELRNIVSTKSVEVKETGETVLKQDKEGAKGGKGLGLATGARVAHTADESNHMLIGNRNDLPEALKSELNTLGDANQKGAVILINSSAFDEKQMENFANIEKNSLLNKYVMYVDNMDANLNQTLQNAERIKDDLTDITNRIAGIHVNEETEDEITSSESASFDAATEHEISQINLSTDNFDSASIIKPKFKLDLGEDENNESTIAIDTSEENSSNIEVEMPEISIEPTESAPVALRKFGLTLNLQDDDVNVEDSTDNIMIADSKDLFTAMTSNNLDNSASVVIDQTNKVIDMHDAIIAPNTSATTALTEQIKDNLANPVQEAISQIETAPVNANNRDSPR